MNDQLTQVERDVILDAVEKNGSPWIIQAKGMANRIFIPQGAASVHAGKILFIPATVVSQDSFAPFTGVDIAVFFFYGGRTLFFSSRVQRISQGTAFVIPPAIFKQPDQTPSNEGKISAKLYYNGRDNGASVIFCESSPVFPLFSPYTWLTFSQDEVHPAEHLLYEIAELEPVIFKNHSPAKEALELSKRILYLPERTLPEKNYFPFQAGITHDDVFASELSLLYNDAAEHNSECFIPFAETINHEVHSIFALRTDSPVVSPFEILRTTLMLPGIRYLIQKDEPVESVFGRYHPYDILYISESKIVLGSRQTDSVLQYGAEFPIAIYASCGPIQREITATLKISQRYDFRNRYFIVGNLLNLKEEDKRFLYEKLYPTVYK